MDHETKKYSHPYVPGREQPMIETVYVLQQQQRLMGRWLFFILVAVLFCFSMLFVLLPYLSEVNPGVREDAGTVGKVSDESVVLDEIRILKSQVGSLITESIQIKVNQLEKSLLDGMISKSDLVAIQELKSDLKVLKTYALQNSIDSLSVFDSGLQKSPSDSVPRMFDAEQIGREISQMKTLFYISMASWGLMLVVVSGVWMHSCYSIKRLEGFRYSSKELLGKPQSEYY